MPPEVAEIKDLDTKKLPLGFNPWAPLQFLFPLQNNSTSSFKDFSDELSLASSKIETNLNNYRASKADSEPGDKKPAVQNNPIAENKGEIAPKQNPAPEQKLSQIIAADKFILGSLQIPASFNNTLLKETSALKLDVDFLAGKIIDQVKLVQEKGRVELNLTLQPDELGEILLSVSLRNGVISVGMTASPETKKILDQNLNELQTSLKRAKLNLGELWVSETQNSRKERRA